MKPISRRQFLQIAGLFGGASLFAGCDLMGSHDPPEEYISGAPGVDPLETIEGVLERYGVCGLCPGGCGISCRISRGRIVKIDGSPYHPVTTADPLPLNTPEKQAIKASGQICAIGSSGIQTLYDPFRIASPLKRVGPRGSGKWEAISWEQAYTEIIHGGDIFAEGSVRGLKELKGKESGLGMLTGHIDWSAEVFLSGFLKSFPGSKAYRESPALISSVADQAAKSVFGPDCGELDANYQECKFVLSIGAAPLDSGVPIVGKVREIMEARLRPNGFEWAVADPRLSTTASKSDHWLPVIPGKDKYLVLGIMLSLMDESAENPQFSIAAIGPGLKEQLRSLSLTTCARECGIAKEKIRYLARRLMQEGPYAAVIPGPGVFAQPKGLETAILIYWLNRIIGAVPGSKGLIQSSDAIFTEAEKTSGSDSATISRAGPLDQAPGALMIWRADPAYHEPELIRDILLKNTETSLAVTVDQRISETAAISDYILPDTTYLERWDICRLPGFLGKSGFSVRKPAVGSLDPDTRAYYPIIAKAKVMEDIFLDLGNELSLDGFEQPKEKADRINAYKVFERRLDSLIEASENLPHRGGFRINRSMITERGIFLLDPEPVSKPVAGPETLPEIPAILPDKPAKGLILITYTLPFHRSPYSGVNSWLLEIIPSNRAIINTEDAKERGIHQNDQVRIMPVGSEIVIQCKAQVSPGIRPGVIALASGFGYDQYGAKGQTIDNTLIKGNKPRSEGVNPSELVGKAVLVSREIS